MLKKISLVVVSSLAISSMSYATSTQNASTDIKPNTMNNINVQPAIGASDTDNNQDSKALYGLVLGVQGGYGKVADIAHTDLDNASNGNVVGAIVGFDFALSHTISFGVESGYDYGYHIIKDNNSNLNYQMRRIRIISA